MPARSFGTTLGSTPPLASQARRISAYNRFPVSWQSRQAALDARFV